MTNQILNFAKRGARCLTFVGVVASASAGQAQHANVGTFLCQTEQRAAISSDHREGSSAPTARLDDDAPTTFKMQIIRKGKGSKNYQLVELPYDGPGRDRADWGDDYSVLHSTYVGDGRLFRANDSPAFFVFGREPLYRSGEPDLEFYHSGFESPGGEDTQLAVRWGRCKKVG